MRTAHVMVGQVLERVVEPITIDPFGTYCTIGVRSFGNGIFHHDPVDGSALSKLRWFKVRPGELIVSNIKGWEGAIALSSEGDSKCIASNRFLTYRPKDDRIDINYVRYFLLSEPGLRLVRKASPGSTDRNLTLGINAFESLEIPLPPRTRQRQIANQLDAIRAKTQAVEARQFGAAQKLAAVVSALVTRGDLSERQKAQRGWSRHTLEEVLQPSRRFESVRRDGRYRIAGVYSFGRGLIDRGMLSGSDTRYKTLASVVEDDVVISRLGGWEGAVAVVDSEFDGAYVSPEYPVFTPHRELLTPKYFTGFAMSPWLWDAIGASTRGSMARRKRIKPEQFLQVEIQLPPVVEQDRIAALIGKALAVGKSLERGRHLLAALDLAALNGLFADLG